MSRRRTLVQTIVGIVVAVVATVLLVRVHHWRPRSLTIQGAVIRKDEDSRKELPISDAQIIVSDGVTSTSAQSDASGYFKITFPEAVWPGQTLDLTFTHAEYQPLDLKLPTGLRLASSGLYVAAMTPIPQGSGTSTSRPVSFVSNMVVRYTVNSETDQNIGSAVRVFQVINKANVPCSGRAPCSPDGRWKATDGAISLDAGPGSEFRFVRASCIAGPCPFTSIDSAGFVNGGRNITATALDWSDTTTFLLEAEVFRAGMASRVRLLYPVVFGNALHFTLPPTEEGVTIEADINGTPMVFPLGPELYLSWATCTAITNTEREKTTAYRCELKPGYSF